MASRITQNRIASIVKSRPAATAGEKSNDAEIEFRTPAGTYQLDARTEVEVLSVNFDRSEPLKTETETFPNDNGLRAFIINPEGEIVMADPDEDALRLLLASR